MEEFLRTHLEEVIGVDLMSNALCALVRATVQGAAAGTWAIAFGGFQDYFRRIDAMEFTISHDDGRNPQDLREADIVLIGVSRSSKTPLSIYLSQLGYRVANVPLDPQKRTAKRNLRSRP